MVWKTCNIRTSTNQPTTYTIEDLQPDTLYVIQVAAVNMCDSGPFSMLPTECSTLQGNTAALTYVYMHRGLSSACLIYLYIAAPAAPSAVPNVSVSSTTDTIKVKIKVRK